MKNVAVFYHREDLDGVLSGVIADRRSFMTVKAIIFGTKMWLASMLKPIIKIINMIPLILLFSETGGSCL